MTIYDCIIVGGGPAGLSAAIYLGRFNRSVMVIDNHHGRSTFPQINHNYLGFPKGISALKLRQLGRLQAFQYGAEFTTDTIKEIEKKPNFVLKGEKDQYQSKTIILAMGVVDILPIFDSCKQYFGHTIFWCITCDGYKARDKKILVVGNNDEAATTCLQFLNYTKDITFITNCESNQCEIADEKIRVLKRYGIKTYNEKIKELKGQKRSVQTVVLENGESIPTELLFTMQGCVPQSDLAKQLSLDLNNDGFITTDPEQKTNIPGVFAAGDITAPHSHQIVSAAHQGSMAAQAVNYDLFKNEFSELID